VLVLGGDGHGRAVYGKAGSVGRHAHGRVLVSSPDHEIEQLMKAFSEHSHHLPTCELNWQAAAAIDEAMRCTALACGYPVPFEAAAAFFEQLCELLERVHATADPVRGGPLAVGVLSATSFLISPAGEIVFTGLGQPLDRRVARSGCAGTPSRTKRDTSREREGIQPGA
jgi:hypothetical protein